MNNLNNINNNNNNNENNINNQNEVNEVLDRVINNLERSEDLDKALIKYDDKKLLEESNLDKAVKEIEKYKEMYGNDNGEENNINDSEYNVFDLIKKIYNDIIKGENIEKLDNNSVINTLSNYDEMEQVVNKVVNSDKVAGLIEKLKNNGKPLGELGDTTINDIITSAANFDFSFIINNSHLVVYPMKLIPAGFIYGGLIRYYIKNSSIYKTSRFHIKNENLRFSFQRYQYRQIRLFVTMIAPALTVALLQKSGYGGAIGIEFFKTANSVLPLLLIQSREVYLDFSKVYLEKLSKISNLFGFWFSKKKNVGKKGDEIKKNNNVHGGSNNNKKNRFYFLLILIFVTILLYFYRNNPILNDIFFYI